MIGQIEKTLAEVAALHADGACPCDVCIAVREFSESPTVKIPFETMRELIRAGKPVL